MRPRAVSGQSALKLIDDASAAIQSSRDQLQHALDHARQGITVFDSNLALTAWNREFADLFDLPPAMLRHGVGLDEIVRFNAARGAYGPGDSEDFVAERVAGLLYDDQPSRLRLFSTHRVIEVRSARLPDGGIVTTYTDVTQTVQTEEALEAANELLERRVDERTAELQRLNAELARAKTVAEEANLSKTRFLAAASHDILQPLNAARLYASSLERRREPDGRRGAGGSGAQRRRLARGGRGDSGRASRHFAPRRRRDEAGDLRRAGRRPHAHARGRVRADRARPRGSTCASCPTQLAVRTDRRLMRRLLQNLVSNAIKYTLKGRVLVGCRRTPGALRIEVWDTGLGIPADQQRAVFEEFQRLDQGARVARGLGLGLSIVERLGRVLDHPIGLSSRPGKGSVFFVTAPLGAPTPPSRDDSGAPRRRRGERAAERPQGARDRQRAARARGHARAARADGAASSRPRTASPRRARRSRAFGAPDVIIADYHLDEGDGIEAIRRLARRPRPRHSRHPRDRRPQPRGARATRRARTSSSSTSR